MRDPGNEVVPLKALADSVCIAVASEVDYGHCEQSSLCSKICDHLHVM